MFLERKFFVLAAAVFAAMIIGSGSWLYAEQLGKHHPKIECKELVGLTVPADCIGLSTKGAEVKSATLVPAAPQTVDAKGNIVGHFEPQGNPVVASILQADGQWHRHDDPAVGVGQAVDEGHPGRA